MARTVADEEAQSAKKRIGRGGAQNGAIDVDYRTCTMPFQASDKPKNLTQFGDVPRRQRIQ
jgi:hypothetical protein